MDIIKILPEYLDVGLEYGELESLVESTIRGHLDQLKRAIANAVISARSCTLMDNITGADKAMGEARKFKKQYHHFRAELARLQGDNLALVGKPESDSELGDGSNHDNHSDAEALHAQP